MLYQGEFRSGFPTNLILTCTAAIAYIYMRCASLLFRLPPPTRRFYITRTRLIPRLYIGFDMTTTVQENTSTTFLFWLDPITLSVWPGFTQGIMP